VPDHSITFQAPLCLSFLTPPEALHSLGGVCSCFQAACSDGSARASLRWSQKQHLVSKHCAGNAVHTRVYSGCRRRPLSLRFSCALGAAR